MGSACEKFGDAVVCVCNGLLYRQFPFWKFSLVLGRDFKRVMGGKSKDCGEKWFPERADLSLEILKLGFVPDSPTAVIIGFVGIFGFSVVLFYPSRLAIGIKPHGSIGTAVEECRMVPFTSQNAGE